MSVNLKSLVGRLNDTCRIALEGAAGLCLSRTNYDIEIEHILIKLLEPDESDFRRICFQFNVTIDKLDEDIETALNRLKTGNVNRPDISQEVIDWIQNTWLIASINFGATEINSGHLILGLLSIDNFAKIAFDISQEFYLISPEHLEQKLDGLIENSDEISEIDVLNAEWID